MLISIILPTYNSINYLSNAMVSILSQNFQDFEVLVMDNLSTDGTIAFMKKYVLKDKRINFVSVKDEGIYDAMNKGISRAQGEWLYFMGADDQVFDEKVFSKVCVNLTAGNDVVYGDCVWMPENRKETGEWSYETFIKANINHQRIFYRKDLFEQYGGFNTKYKVAADHELNIRFFCNPSIKTTHIPLIICNYHSGGFSAKKTDEAFWSDWDEIVLKNFTPWLPKKIIFGSLGTYIRYLMENKQYGKTFKTLVTHYRHTHSLGFLKLMCMYYLKLAKNGK